MNTVVRARIDQATKDEAIVILDTIGLTVSDAFRLMMATHRRRETTSVRAARAQRHHASCDRGRQPRRPRHGRLRRGYVRHPARRP